MKTTSSTAEASLREDNGQLPQEVEKMIEILSRHRPSTFVVKGFPSFGRPDHVGPFYRSLTDAERVKFRQAVSRVLSHLG